MKLNLGSGTHRPEGYINVDKCGECGADERWDVRNLPLDDYTVDEILALHIIESFYAWEMPSVLAEWNRVLKLGGKLILEGTDRNKACRMALSDDRDQRRTGVWGLYGNQENEEQNTDTLHKYTYSRAEILQLLLAAGFYQTKVTQAKTHVPERDFRIVSRK